LRSNHTMFHKNIKLIIAGLLVITGIWFWKQYRQWIFLIIDCDSNFLYFKNEFILLFLKLRKQDFEGAKKLVFIKTQKLP
jgi:hypothetical protein